MSVFTNATTPIPDNPALHVVFRAGTMSLLMEPLDLGRQFATDSRRRMRVDRGNLPPALRWKFDQVTKDCRRYKAGG
ncbi:MAG: hypothetical protein ACLPWF_18140 [Bryobacteraceae bacterium]|jgi:hypothetical protein